MAADTLTKEDLEIFLVRANFHEDMSMAAQASIEKRLVYEHGLLQYDNNNQRWSLTERGRVLLDHYCAIALPIKVWVIPNEGEEN